MDDDIQQLGITQSSWVPETNRYGGWYGRNARPGDVKIAFVAERVNENVVRQDWPPLYGGVSGLYLWRAIANAGMKPHDMYFSNVAKPMGKIDDLWMELNNEVLADHVVALGQFATHNLWRAGVDHIGLPHPAYWRKFYYHSFDQYVKWLKEIVAT